MDAVQIAKRIEKRIELRAPVARVWRALTDHVEFGAWFGVQLEGPFVPGQVARGRITTPGYEHLPFEARIEALEPERTFAFRWPHEGALDIDEDPLTLVEFTLEPVAGGTRLVLVESGFERLPSHLRDRAFTGNDGGWTEQLRNIERHLAASA